MRFAPQSHKIAPFSPSLRGSDVSLAIIPILAFADLGYTTTARAV